MSWHRKPPPAPESDPLSAHLLRAIGDLQTDEAGLLLDDLAAIGAAAEILTDELPQLIARGIARGYIEDDEDGAVRLTARG